MVRNLQHVCFRALVCVVSIKTCVRAIPASAKSSADVRTLILDTPSML